MEKGKHDTILNTQNGKVLPCHVKNSPKILAFEHGNFAQHLRQRHGGDVKVACVVTLIRNLSRTLL